MKSILLLVKNEEHVREMRSVTPPPSVYLGRRDVIHMINIPGLPPPFLHTASDQKLDGGKAWKQGYISASRVEKVLSKTAISGFQLLQVASLIAFAVTN